MRIPETWKRTIKSFSSYTYAKQNEASSVTVPPPNTSSSIHSTPAGQYPSEGPQSGKLGVIFYYLLLLLYFKRNLQVCYKLISRSFVQYCRKILARYRYKNKGMLDEIHFLTSLLNFFLLSNCLRLWGKEFHSSAP